MRPKQVKKLLGGNGLLFEKGRNKMKSTNDNIVAATHAEVEFIDDELGEFNRSQVPVT